MLLKVDCGLFQGLFAFAGEDWAKLSGFDLIGEAVFFSFGEGTPDTPVLNPLVNSANEREVGFDPFAGGVQREGCCQVHGYGDQ